MNDCAPNGDNSLQERRVFRERGGGGRVCASLLRRPRQEDREDARQLVIVFPILELSPAPPSVWFVKVKGSVGFKVIYV